MITVSVTKLIEAIHESNAFALPEMCSGMNYLYNNVYLRLSTGSEVLLSEIDFDKFEAEDISSLNSLHSDVFERNSYESGKITWMLRQIKPICKPISFV